MHDRATEAPASVPPLTSMPPTATESRLIAEQAAKRQVDGEVLWLLDLNRDGQPLLAHRVVHESEDRAEAACGRSSGPYHFGTGWWTTKPGKLPLQRQWIHCGLDDDMPEQEKRTEPRA